MSLESITAEWDELSKEYNKLEDVSNEYNEMLEKLEQLQQKCMKDMAHQRYRVSQISSNLKQYTSSNVTTSIEKDKVADLEKNIIKRKAQLYDIDQTLPQKNGTYLNIIVGDVNVSILNRKSKLQYKDDYEKFKLILNGIGLFMAIINLSYNSRVLELSFIFLLVWYYCTLTIRESILKVNGSRIKGWWRTHHFISTVCAGVLLIWPQGEPWQLFRNQFMYFNAYISMVQFLQFRYQRGVLYRLKALGERHDMDITIEGFHSWMWRGLSFLLPFLFVGYMFQAFNSYVLWQLSKHADAPWQVVALSILFFILFVGNTLTTLLVIPEKIFTRVNEHYRLLALAKKEKEK